MGDLVYDEAELARARAIVVCVPGALSSTSIFDPVLEWRNRGYGIARYRFPGLDGRPLDPPLRIAEASHEIAELVARYPGKPVRLLGYSTGGPIVISAACEIGQRDLRVAAMSSAVEGGGGLRTGLTGLWDVLTAAGRKLSMRTGDIWMEYYRVLLFGRQVLTDAELAARADEMIAAHRPSIVMPDGGKPRAHTDDLRTWRLPAELPLPPERLHFFVGLEDPVFSPDQTLAFAQKCGCAHVTGYPGQGHLLFLSCDVVFADVLEFFEDRRIPENGRVMLA